MIVLERGCLSARVGDQTWLGWSVVDVDGRTQSVLEEVGDSAIGDLLDML